MVAIQELECLYFELPVESQDKVHCTSGSVVIKGVIRPVLRLSFPQECRHFATDAVGARAYHPRSTPQGGATRRGSIPPDGGAALKTRMIDLARPLCDDAHNQTIEPEQLMADTIIENPILNSPFR